MPFNMLSALAMNPAMVDLHIRPPLPQPGTGRLDLPIRPYYNRAQAGAWAATFKIERSHIDSNFSISFMGIFISYRYIYIDLLFNS